MESRAQNSFRSSIYTLFAHPLAITDSILIQINK